MRGRFAPTPSGPLHFGSLVAALANALDVKSRQGLWFLRIDDLDLRRAVAGAPSSIIADLERLGFEWHGKVEYQRPHMTCYREAAERLRAAGAAFDCACTRREIAAAAVAEGQGQLYPGTCRSGIASGRRARSIRLRVPDEPLAFDDDWHGRTVQNLARAVGDFVIWRADGIAAYHLATVLDDARLGINRIVRGTDLLASAPRQIYLQRLLGLPIPTYAHHPLVSERGHKLGKQTKAPRVDTTVPARPLVAALEFLGQSPPPDLAEAELQAVWHWAITHWNPAPLGRP